MTYSNLDLDNLRAKLVHLVNQVTQLLDDVHYLSLLETGTLPLYRDIIQRYTVIASGLVGVSASIRQAKWANAVAVPVLPVDENNDWIVGTLLRTKQAPEIEQRQADLVASLPSIDLERYRTFLAEALDIITRIKEGENEDEGIDPKMRVELPSAEDLDKDEGLYNIEQIMAFQRTGKLS